MLWAGIKVLTFLFAEPPVPAAVSSSDEEEDMSKLLDEAVTEAFDNFGPEMEDWYFDFFGESLWTRAPATTSNTAESAGKKAQQGKLLTCQ